MNILKKVYLFLLLLSYVPCNAVRLAEQLQVFGYAEIADYQAQAAHTFDMLYFYFDQLVDFLQENPACKQKLYLAKERFIRSKSSSFYGTDFFGLYDQSHIPSKAQIAFYYSVSFHQFLMTHFQELYNIPALHNFLEACYAIQEPSHDLFFYAAEELQLNTMFRLQHQEDIPILYKIVKYLPHYMHTKPHYDGTVFSLFLHSTDPQAVLVAPYQELLTIEAFKAPVRTLSNLDAQQSMILILGGLLTDYGMYPTPHIVVATGQTRYATIAFAMRPHYIRPKIEFAALPSFYNIIS